MEEGKGDSVTLHVGGDRAGSSTEPLFSLKGGVSGPVGVEG